MKNYCEKCGNQILYTLIGGGKTKAINPDGTDHVCISLESHTTPPGGQGTLPTAGEVSPAITPTPTPAPTPTPDEQERKHTLIPAKDMMSSKDRMILWEWSYGRAVEVVSQGIFYPPGLDEFGREDWKKSQIRNLADWFVDEIDERIERGE